MAAGNSGSGQEQDREQQTDEFRQLADSIPQMAWMADANGRITWYNRRWYEFTGTNPEQMEERGWEILHDPAILPRVLEAWNTSLATGEVFEMEFPLRAADGSFRSFLTRVTPLKNNRSQVLRWFGTNTDIEDRVKSERAASQLAAIVESSQDAIIGKSLDGVIESWNCGAEKLYGYSRAEMLGQSMQVLAPPERAGEEYEILRKIRGGECVESMETTRITKSGERVIVSLAVSPIHNTRGQIIGASHIARNITEQKEFESRMLEVQKLESLGVLAGGIAHDFNNLLTGIMGNSSLLVEQMPPGGQAREMAEAIVLASERAAALTRQLLAYAGKGRFVIENLDLSELTEQITQLVHASIPRKVRLLLDLDRPLPLVQGDPSQLQQVIMNLLINAAEAIGGERGTVTVRTWVQDEDGRNLSPLSPDSDLPPGLSAVLEVTDTGAGMARETLSRIFDPFFTTKFAGRGLGLAAVQGIIRGHKGKLEVFSTLGTGSRFRVSLPVASKSGSSGLRRERNTLLHGRGRILVVEDDSANRSFIRSVLEQYGYSVEVAQDGRHAIEVFSRDPSAFHLVFLDLTMPVMDGEEAFQRLQVIRPGVPILVTSGYNSATAIQHLTGTGLVGFIQKPYTAVQLAGKIKEALPCEKPSSGEKLG